MKHLRVTIGAKLVGLIAILLLSSVFSLVWLSTRMFIEDNTALIQQMNIDKVSDIAGQTREIIENVTEKVRVLATTLTQESIPPVGKEKITQEFFRKDKDFLAAFLIERRSGKPEFTRRAISPELENLHDPLGKSILESVNRDPNISLDQLFKGEIQVSVIKLADGAAALFIGIPYIKQGSAFSHCAAAVIRQSRFTKIFSESEIITAFLVDRRGKLLAHTDVNRVLAGENVGRLGIVKLLLEGKFNNGQTRYADPLTQEVRLGAYKTLGFGGLGVVAEVPEAKAFEAAKRVESRSILVAFVILCFAFLAGYRYSGTITWPIKQLMAASKKISQGDFAIQLRPKGNDEIAELSFAMNEMAKGLEERERVKETFNKFHSKEIAEKLLSGEVKLGGERKQATIFFSDVRGFTAMSETMEPEQVVEMLNEYMTRMVAIIRAHGGVVDKYVGDAIMALWGVPIGGKDDVYQAVKACIAMRQELVQLNKLRISRGQNALKIGMGLNCGPVIAGNIGSDEKMEYTVIGDTVNTASRMESMTKQYGTDLLIPKAIRDRVKDRFIFEKCSSAKVKGKSEALEVFKVKGYVDDRGKSVIVETPYSSYKSEKSDKAA